jgi:prolyl oligopeptidase PreP (S9A serine peptidase family)
MPAASDDQEDPYLSLENVDSPGSLNFAVESSKACLTSLGDPTKSKTQSYKRILGVLEADDRIPFVSKMGKDVKGNDLLYNLWKDAKVSICTTTIPDVAGRAKSLLRHSFS